MQASAAQAPSVSGGADGRSSGGVIATSVRRRKSSTSVAGVVRGVFDDPVADVGQAMHLRLRPDGDEAVEALGA